MHCKLNGAITYTLFLNAFLKWCIPKIETSMQMHHTLQVFSSNHWFDYKDCLCLSLIETPNSYAIFDEHYGDVRDTASI